MTLSRAVALAAVAATLATGAIVLQTGRAEAQYYSSDRGYGSYRRYNRYADFDYQEERRYRRRASRYRDSWFDPADMDEGPYARRRQRDRDFLDDGEKRKPRSVKLSDEVRSGGPRPALAAKSPPLVTLRTGHKPGTILIDQSARKLYYVVSASAAYRYPISVGREGFSWTGSEKISRIADWPDWHPPKEMRERDPKLPAKMTGGVNNPLGAKAIYLGNTLYRIHGTNNPKSIGQAASSGCFRMMNQHVLHLARMANVGAQVHVMKHLPKNIATAQ